MFIVRANPDGSFTELPPTDVVVGSGETAITIPFLNFSTWMAQGSRSAHGLYIVPTSMAPKGKRRTGYSFAWSADKTAVEYVPTYEVEPQEVPQSATKRQIKLALLAQGKLTAIEVLVANSPLQVQIGWADSLTYSRTDPMMLSIAAVNGWTSAELDALFITAQAY